MQLLSPKLHKRILEIKKCLGNGDYDKAYSLAQAAINEFPNSTELISLYLTLAQLSNQQNITLVQIKNELLELMKFQEYSNIETIVDNLGMRHNVFDEKSRDIEHIFEVGYNLMTKHLRDFMKLYCSYLSEKGEMDKISVISEALQGEIISITNNDEFLKLSKDD